MHATLLLLPLVLGAIYYLVGASDETRPAEVETRAAVAAAALPYYTVPTRYYGCRPMPNYAGGGGPAYYGSPWE